MKRLASLIVVLAIALALSGCAGMTPEGRSDKYYIRGCGNQPSLSEPNLCYYQKFGY